MNRAILRAVFLRAASLSLTFIVLACGCRPPPDARLPLCEQGFAEAANPTSAGEEFPKEAWIQLLFEDVPGAGRSLDTVRTCTGDSIVAPLPAQCGRQADPSKSVLKRPLTASNIIVSQLEGHKALVWIAAFVDEQGRATGPVALIQRLERAVHVDAIGILQMFPSEAELRLERVSGATVLVAEGRDCREADAPCTPVVHLSPLLDRRFASVPLFSNDGSCLGPSTLRLAESHDVMLPQGTLRRFELTRSLRGTTNGFVVEEHANVTDVIPNSDEPPVPFRKAELNRFLGLTTRGFTIEQGMWEALIGEQGAVAAEKKPSRAAGM